RSRALILLIPKARVRRFVPIRDIHPIIEKAAAPRADTLSQQLSISRGEVTIVIERSLSEAVCEPINSGTSRENVGRALCLREAGLAMTAQRNERSDECTIESTRRKRCHAGRLDRPIERCVIRREPLVVRPISWLVDVEKRHDQRRTLHVAPDA